MSKESLFVLVVALLTWGGVFLYLLRLELLTRHLERQVQEMDSLKAESVEEERG